MRRATPSSSISASAVVSWLDVATTTERPASSASRPARVVPRARCLAQSRAARSQKNRSGPASATRSLSDGALLRTIFIHFHEVAERQREHGVLGGRERIDAERVFETRDEHRKTERVQTGIEQHQIVAQRRQRLAVFACDLPHLLHYG